MRTKIDTYEKFQQIHSLEEVNIIFDDSKYCNIHIKFLEMLFGEDWQDMFDNAYGQDMTDFMNDYGTEYEEWLEFEI